MPMFNDVVKFVGLGQWANSVTQFVAFRCAFWPRTVIHEFTKIMEAIA